jgi:hypothetical protein
MKQLVGKPVHPVKGLFFRGVLFAKNAKNFFALEL